MGFGDINGKGNTYITFYTKQKKLPIPWDNWRGHSKNDLYLGVYPKEINNRLNKWEAILTR